jgi:hypothetical protein
MTIKGKNFSANNSSGQRKESDFYETPYSLTRLLLSKETLTGTLLEPACGNGAIVKVLQEYGYTVTGYDIETDFLKESQHYDTIITNPPFSLAKEFIYKAKEVSDRFYFLLPLSYLHGKERYDTIYCDKSFKLRKVYVFTRYPMLGDVLREDGKHRTGMMVYAWYCFERGWVGASEIDWLDNNDCVCKKQECNAIQKELDNKVPTEGLKEMFLCL